LDVEGEKQLLQLYVREPNDLTIRNVENLRRPESDDVKIKVSVGGICGSDLSFLKGKFAHGTYPLTPGHELVGTIIECGDKSLYEVGTRVVVLPNTYCGTCVYCQKGQTNICANKQSFGINKDGGFAEEFVLSSKFVLPLSDELSDDRAVIIEPFAVVVRAFKKVTITKGTSVAIIGGGTIGLLAAALANYLGADVTVTDINPKKHSIVEELGPVRAVYPEAIEGDTFDIVIEAAGTAASFKQAVQAIKPGGSMVAVGIVPDVEIPATQIVRNDQTIYGSIIYRFPEDYEETIAYLKDPNLHIEPIFSLTFPISQYETAFEKAQSGDYAKITLDFRKKD